MFFTEKLNLQEITRETDRQTDREGDRQTDREGERQSERERRKSFVLYGETMPT